MRDDLVGRQIRHVGHQQQLAVHAFGTGQCAFVDVVAISEPDYLTGSKAGSTALAENYVGLPIE